MHTFKLPVILSVELSAIKAAVLFLGLRMKKKLSLKVLFKIYGQQQMT